MENQRISNLPGLGPVSEKLLASIGINSAAELRQLGPVNAYLQLEHAQRKPQSLNLLYAMVAALEQKHWTQIAREEKSRLLTELDGAREYRKVIKNEFSP